MFRVVNLHEVHGGAIRWELVQQHVATLALALRHQAPLNVEHPEPNGLLGIFVHQPKIAAAQEHKDGFVFLLGLILLPAIDEGLVENSPRDTSALQSSMVTN